MKNEINWEDNVIISVMEIARVVLEPKPKDEPFHTWPLLTEYILKELDISDEEAEVLFQRIEEYMNDDI